jgi:multidrug resistance efflux pump
MLEILLCSLITVLPDYLYRRYGQGKRIGKEITVFSVWYELRWGITACLMLAVALITVVFYNHPSTKNVTAYFRVIPIVPETSGRVAEVFVTPIRSDVSKGDPIFRLDDSRERAAVETARRRLAEAVASLDLAKAELATADARIQQAKSDYQQVLDELQTKQELLKRNADTVPRREIERLTVTLEAREGAVNAAIAQRDAAVAKLEKLAPAQKASAEAALEQAEVELRKTLVSAGVDGRIEQFSLRVGDIVNPFMRPAGVLIPKLSGRGQLYAGFSQIEAQVMRPGMIAEVACLSKPFTVIPMVVTSVQDFIAAGQLRTGDQLIDAQQVMRPGTLTVALEPLYEGGLADIPPGSSCIANAYSSNHERLKNEKLGFFHRIYLHGVDAVAVVHAMLLRIQALVMPVKALVGGH